VVGSHATGRRRLIRDQGHGVLQPCGRQRLTAGTKRPAGRPPYPTRSYGPL
jgi:hypothetical protein